MGVMTASHAPAGTFVLDPRSAISAERLWIVVAILLAGALAVAGFALAAALPPSQPSPPASFLVPTAP